MLYAGIGFLGLAFVYFCVIETKGKSLEEISAELAGKKLQVELAPVAAIAAPNEAAAAAVAVVVADSVEQPSAAPVVVTTVATPGTHADESQAAGKA